METKYFKDFDFAGFWDDDDYSKKNYVEPPPTDEVVASIEKELGYKLPASYIELAQLHNGGAVLKNCFPTNEPTSWAEDHIQIEGIYSIGRRKEYSLCNKTGSAYLIKEWGYPPIGIIICTTPSGGHDMVMLDYSNCGKNGEPEVVHIDQEYDYKKIVLAKDFETFIRGLVSEDELATGDDEDNND